MSHHCEHITIPTFSFASVNLVWCGFLFVSPQVATSIIPPHTLIYFYVLVGTSTGMNI